MNPYELRERFQNLATAKKPWYRFENQAAGSPTKIHIFDAIGGFDGVTADGFITELDQIEGAVDLFLNSTGGEVFQAKAIYNALKRRNDVRVYVDGLAASAASFIAMAASPHQLFMSSIGTMMIHDGFTVAAGNAGDLRKLADVLDKESNTIAGIYAKRTGKEVDYFRAKMQEETWYTAEEAMADGLCDGIYDERSGKITNAASVPYVGERQVRHEPMTGRHRHDHAAYEASDHDDGVHFHMHEHRNDSDHAHAHTPGMLGRGSDDGPEHSGDIVGDFDTIIQNAFGVKFDAAGELIGDVTLAEHFHDAEFYDRNFSSDQRKRLAKKGHALPDGSYPIENCQDAHNARQAYGRAHGDRAAVAAHIRKRESALGGCNREKFSPGTSDATDLVISDQDLVAIQANFKL